MNRRRALALVAAVAAGAVTGELVTTPAQGADAHAHHPILEEVEAATESYRAQLAAAPGREPWVAFKQLEAFRHIATVSTSQGTCTVVTVAEPGLLKLRHVVSGAAGVLHSLAHELAGRHIPHHVEGGTAMIIATVVPDPSPVHRVLVRAAGRAA